MTSAFFQTAFPAAFLPRLARTSRSLRATETSPALPEDRDTERARREMLLDLLSSQPEGFFSGESLIEAALHFSGRS